MLNSIPVFHLKVNEEPGKMSQRLLTLFTISPKVASTAAKLNIKISFSLIDFLNSLEVVQFSDYQN